MAVHEPLASGSLADDLGQLWQHGGPLEPPIRSVVFGLARFEQHGHSLAATHEVIGGDSGGGRFFPRLQENADVLRTTRALLERHVGEGQHLGPAAHWLLDNAALLEQQIETIYRGLPRSFFRLLPRLRDEPLAGLPRIYSIAWAWVAHTDSSLDTGLLEAYLRSYQSVRELTLAELWALPSTLRVVLLENLRRLAERIALTQAARDAAHRWIDLPDDERSLSALATLDSALLEHGVAEPFRLQLQQREDELPVAAGHELAIWLAQRLPDVGLALSHQQNENTEDHQSIRNAITTLRSLDRIDWRRIVASTNRAMLALARSPVFAAEREDTQDSSLHAVERLARESGAPESQIAAVMIDLAAAAESTDPRQAALAHWYDGPGEPALRSAIGLKPRRLPRFGSPAWRRGAATIYLSALALLSIASVISALHQHGLPSASPWLLAVTGLLMLGPASEAVVAVVNRLISESGRPTHLPRMAFKDGIPAAHRTLVVIPALLSSPTAIDALTAQLEQHAIANREAQVQFALLSDWVDAPTRQLADDQLLLDIAADAIDALNRKYPTGASAPPRFLLLHRTRSWSESEQHWIGWERKRGKLELLVRALCEPGLFPFLALGELSEPAPDIRYVVTLDADTDMPPGRLRALVGVAAHPLNQPQFDSQRRLVVAGYGILQPRVVTPLPEPETVTWFHRLFSGQCGIDPYSAASSEVYQDLFGEGTFTGKGLLNVAAVHAALVGRLPEAQVLSHDLLEGAIVRCGSVSDITLVEDAPVHADVANSRLHRWTRGDWQLLPFILRARQFPLSTISRWKMIDNLRRSLVAPMSLLLLLLVSTTGVMPLGWALLIVAAAFGAGPLLGALAGLAPSRDDIALRLFYRHAIADLARAFALSGWHLAQLLQLAMLYGHAITLALYRQLWSRRALLQWTTAAAAQSAAARDLPQLLQQHWRIPLLATLLGAALLGTARFDTLLQMAATALLLSLWAASPVWTWLASRPRPVPRRERLDQPAREWLQGLARDTWRYYEHHVGADDNHLPPDNVQHAPHLLIAHRTSPTNIGMYLLSAVSVQALGFIGRAELIDRLTATLDTLERMPRHRGHFFNWYDTQTLAVLPPAYVSTVDSGNCSGHLLAVAGACAALSLTPPSSAPARLALRVSARRLDALQPMLQHAGSMRETQALFGGAEIDWPANPADLADLRARVQCARVEIDALNLGLFGSSDDASMWLLHDQVAMLDSALRDLEQDPGESADRLSRLADRCRQLALEPDYAMLYDAERRLLHIGYRVETHQLDDSHYDLLASEARLTSLLAIAKGDLPVEHWAALGRPFFGWGTEVGLKSWSGSMFEYLMPSLILDEPIGSVLYQVTRSAVSAQRADSEHRSTPWGISESAVAGQDHTLAYQYGPQGVARLALRRTPADELVVAPYASAMALMVAPVDALANLRRLQQLGARHVMGFIEAIDYTPLRQIRGSDCIPVDTFMAHHQAMSLVAIADVLTDGAPRGWAMADPLLRAVKALLHERAPREVPLLRDPPPLPRARRLRSARLVHEHEPLAMALPATHLLTNGHHAVVLRSHGGGYSMWDGIGLTRWRDDLLRDDLGSFFYIRRAGAPDWHSITAHPAADPAASYRCRLQADRAIFDANWPDLHSRCTVWVAPEDDCEMRQIDLSNNGRQTLELSLASFAEPTLTAHRADESHPAFSKLFVQARWDPLEQALYFRRQPRLNDEQPLYAVHFLSLGELQPVSVTACTDRARWLGRYGSTARPLGDGGQSLLPESASSFDGPGDAVDTGLDPLASMAVCVRIEPGQTVRLTFCSAASREIESLAASVDKYRQASHAARASSMSHTMAGIRLRELPFDTDTWAAMLHLNTLVTALVTRESPPPEASGDAGRCDRRVLWRHGISGDRPIVLVGIRREQGLGLLTVLKKALRLWSAAALGVDLVVLNAEPASYLSPVQHQLVMLRERAQQQRGTNPSPWASQMFILTESALDQDDLRSLHMLARVRLQADGRSLAQQIERLLEDHARSQQLRNVAAALPVASVLPAALTSERLAAASAPVHRFAASNGAVSFAVTPARHPARPWVNVLANPRFGCQVSELGSGFTWAGNSRLHQVTGWSNDPLCDPPSEWLLLHDLDNRKVWPLGRMLSEDSPCEVVHGIGHSRLRQRIDDIEIQLQWSVDAELPLRQLSVTLRRLGRQPRRLRLVAVAEWTLGGSRAERLSLSTSGLNWTPAAAGEGLPRQAAVRVLQATQNDHLGGFGGATAFIVWRGVSGQTGGAALDDWTCDRRELFDNAGRLVLPRRLQAADGAGLDACAALGCELSIVDSTATSCTLLLGHAPSPAAASALLEQAWTIEPELRQQRQRAQLDHLLGGIRVETPDPAFDALVNHWLPYQTLVCRLWARAGFYQAGGAFGFRDQLQDAMSLVNHAPVLLAQQIRANAARQFGEGDVQHWWHEPGGAGVRTHFSDDLLWLPYACALYLHRTGDASLLDEPIPFLVGSPIPDGAEDIYETPQPGPELASIYEHAARAIDRSLRVGSHGLPLFGTGDWNDGMNRVGHLGRGESVWLAWFACAVVQDMLPIAAARGDAARVAAWTSARREWRAALDAAAWDGDWYRRGFFDDGSALGSATNPEARIDLIAQAWAVLSGAGNSRRAMTAMASARRLLFDEPNSLLRLLDPPLRHAEPSAGYIQAYPPGVRENGGQYNHAGVWGMMAWSQLGDADMAWRVFISLSPAHRWQDAQLGAAYAIEPYVMAGDIYTHEPYVGRGGWSWYTGSGGWLARAAIETICGVVLQHGTLTVRPGLPSHWPEVSITLRRGSGPLRLVICAAETRAVQAMAREPDARRLAPGMPIELASLPEGTVLVVTAMAVDAVPRTAVNERS